MTGLNPFDWYGSAFLALYLFLFAGALLGSFAIAAWLRPDGRAFPVTGEDELAVLAGGETRLGETVLARLLARGEAWFGQGGVHFAPRSAGASSAERDVLSLSSPSKWREIRAVLAGSAVPIERQLIDRGLLMEPDEARRLGLFAAIPFMLLAVVGLGKCLIGDARDRPIGFLVAMLVATVIVAAIRILRSDRRTRAGVAAFTDARGRAERLARAPTEAETGMAVALFGTAVLIGTPLGDLHTIRREKSDGGGGCGGGGSDGGSGCGGGGCGGCGG